MLPFRRLYFFVLIEVRSETASLADYLASLESVVVWSAALLFGPSALWLAVFWAAVELVSTRRFLRGALQRCNRLRNTGLPLGILEDATWEERSLQLGPGDRLLLYTDGVTEAQDAQGGFFGVERMLEVARQNAHGPAEALQEALLAGLQRFASRAPQADDMALLVLAREP